MNTKNTLSLVILSASFLSHRVEAEVVLINQNNETGGGLVVSDDGGFYDYNDGWVTYVGTTGLKVTKPLSVVGNWIFADGFVVHGGAIFHNDQGGSLELGHPVGSGSIPYIDFHHGVGSLQDFNVRLINDADGSLSLQSAAPAVNFMIQSGGYVRSPGRLHIQTHSGEDLHLQPHAGAGMVRIGANDGPGMLWVKSKIWTTELELLSDRHAKADLQPIDAREALEKVAALSIHSWAYTNAPGVRHLGPMAQDFHAAFGLGDSDRHISVVDGLGIALAAIQGLKQEVADRDAHLKTLQDQIAALRREFAGERATPNASRGESGIPFQEWPDSVPSHSVYDWRGINDVK